MILGPPGALWRDRYAQPPRFLTSKSIEKESRSEIFLKEKRCGCHAPLLLKINGLSPPVFIIGATRRLCFAVKNAATAQLSEILFLSHSNEQKGSALKIKGMFGNPGEMKLPAS